MVLSQCQLISMIKGSHYCVQTLAVAFSVLTEILKEHPGKRETVRSHSLNFLRQKGKDVPIDSEQELSFSVNKILICPANSMIQMQYYNLIIDELFCV